jgi:hypothetical protein
MFLAPPHRMYEIEPTIDKEVVLGSENTWQRQSRPSEQKRIAENGVESVYRMAMPTLSEEGRASINAIDPPVKCPKLDSGDKLQ